jgi:hypothetical protein
LALANLHISGGSRFIRIEEMQLSGISPRPVLDDEEFDSFSLIDAVEEILAPINELIEKTNLC